MSLFDYKPDDIKKNVQAFADGLPGGKAYSGKNIEDTTHYRLLKAISQEMIRYQENVFEVAKNYIPNFKTGFIKEWELFMGIPDDCFEAKDANGDEIYDDSERLRNIIIKLAFMNLQTEEDYIALAEILDLTIEVKIGAEAAILPLEFPIAFGEANVLIIKFFAPTFNSFPYVFPIEFKKSNVVLYQCLVAKQKPAQVRIEFEYEII